MKAIRSCNSDHVMPTTLRTFGEPHIVLQLGSRSPTAVGGRVPPRKDVRGVDRFYDEPMLRAATLGLRGRLRRRAELIPPGYSWSFVLLVDTSMVLILAAAMLQRTRADLPAAAIAALLAVAPLLLFFLAGVRFLPTLVWVTSYVATVILLFATSTPIAGDIAPTLLVVALGSVAALVP